MKKEVIAFVCILSFIFISIPVPAKETVLSGLGGLPVDEGEAAAYALLGGAGVDGLRALSVRPGDVLELPLHLYTFLDENGIPIGPDIVTPALLAASKVKVRHSANIGPQAVASVNFTPGGTILVSFRESLVQTRELAFECRIYLTFDGRRDPLSEIIIAGEISNPIITVSPGLRSVDLSGGHIAQAAGYIREIDVHLGHGVSVSSTFFTGSRYYGVAKLRRNNPEEGNTLLRDYPEVELLYTLDTVGLRRDNLDNVTLRLPKLYYAYNSAGDYIGTTRGALPYSPVYYLSSSYIAAGLRLIDFPS